MAGITSRQSPPPGPPAPFDPNARPPGIDPRLPLEHARLKPGEPGGPQAPPVPQTFNNLQPQASNVPPLFPVMPQPVSSLNPKEALLRQYPQYRWHATKAPKGILVKDPDEDAKLKEKDGWSKTPIKVSTVSTEERLDTLSDLLAVLADEADSPDEGPLECLERIIAERDKYAKIIAAKAKE